VDFFTTYSLLVLSAARKDSQEFVHQDETSMPDAAAPGKYPVNTLIITREVRRLAIAILGIIGGYAFLPSCLIGQ